MKVRASHILVNSRETAERILERLNANTSGFEDMAKEYSNCPSKKRGGDLGFFGKGEMVKPFERTAFNMKKGETKIVKTDFGYHVLKITGIRK